MMVAYKYSIKGNLIMLAKQ